MYFNTNIVKYLVSDTIYCLHVSDNINSFQLLHAYLCIYLYYGMFTNRSAPSFPYFVNLYMHYMYLPHTLKEDNT